MEPRKILACLAYKYDGEWDMVFNAIRRKDKILDSEIEEIHQKINSEYITILDKEYPERLKNIFRPPIVLFYKGDISLLNQERILGIVGPREPTEYQEKAAELLINDLDKDIVIVSGLAKGIDGLAHKYALKNDLKTIAFLGCGINEIYPYENLHLYKDIEEKGLLISEYPNLVKPNMKNFPIRNRLIAGVSKGVLCIGGKPKSGTAHTIRFATSSNRDVFAIPEPITEEESLCNEILKDGGIFVTSSKDLNEEI